MRKSLGAFSFAFRTLPERWAPGFHQLVDERGLRVGEVGSANQRIGESGDQFDELGLVAGASLRVQA
jgi:hypothetical protein